MHITAQGPTPHLRNDLYCVEWDVKLYYTIPYLANGPVIVKMLGGPHNVLVIWGAYLFVLLYFFFTESYLVLMSD